MKDAQIQTLMAGARTNTVRARRFLVRGDKDNARKHADRATRCLELARHARLLSAVSQFIR